jgi:hypothetical protein
MKRTDMRLVTLYEAGHFVMACLRNSFVDAVCRASEDSFRGILEVAKFLHNGMPSNKWRTIQAVDAWMKKKADERAVKFESEEEPIRR